MKRDEKGQLIKNTLFSIKDLLNGEDDYVMIPDYQRGFAWDSEFIALLDDIENFRTNLSNNNNKQYYLSMITINECNDDIQKHDENLSGKNLFYIVDGQQRITSLIIIMVTMLTMIEKEDNTFEKLDEYKNILKIFGSDDIYSFTYSNKRKDNSKEFFINYIFKNNTNYMPKDKYSNFIKNARDNLQSRLDKLSIEEIENILIDIVENFVFTVYYIEDEKFDVRISFETMNNRGKQLSNLEKLKNRLLYLTQYIQDINNSNKLRDKVNKTWASIYDNLSYKNELLSDDDFLKAHYFIYFRVDKESGNKYFNDLMNKEFSFDYNDKFRNMPDKDKFSYISTYLDSLENYSKYFRLVSVCESLDLSISPIEIKWLKRFRRLDTSLYIKSFLMFFINKIDNENKRIDYYKKLENYIFIKKYINYKETTLLSLDTFITCLKNMDIDNNLNELEQKTIFTNTSVSDYLNSFFDKFTTIEKSKDLFYDWDYGLRYFLFQYNESIEGDSDDISWYKLEKTSIEHILPQTPNTDYWKIAFEKYINNTEKMKIITNLLGNFILLKNASQNSKLSNYSYPIKRGANLDNTKNAYKFSYFDGTKSQRLLAQSDSFKYWTLKQIIERTNTLFDFMYNTWFTSYIKKEDFLDIIKKYIDVFNLDIDDNYQNTYKKLDSLDLEKEKEEAYKNCDIQNIKEDDKVSKFKRYFSLKNCWINSSQLRFLENCFVGRYIKKDNLFEFAYLFNNKRITLKYYFKDNKMLIYNSDKDNSNIKNFTESFDRYIIRSGLQKNKSEKEFINITNGEKNV